jgi:hypothetical protein
MTNFLDRQSVEERWRLKIIADAFPESAQAVPSTHPPHRALGGLRFTDTRRTVSRLYALGRTDTTTLGSG